MEIMQINKNDNLYPKQLLDLDSPPKKLYAIGNLDLLKESGFSVVGTRKITEYGKRNCKKICKEFALRNVPLISGLAIGTDTVVHETALKYNGYTIAILPSGFNKIYPKENEKLLENIIAEKGLALSEYEPNTVANSNRFLERNRIVAALGKGILVVEALQRSGTSVTVNFAIKAKRDAFAIPRKY